MTLTVVKAETIQDFENIRRIRNLGSAWFEDTHEVSSEEQEHFRQVVSYPIWLYKQEEQVVGYGLVSPRDDGRDYISLAVDLTFRGMKFGVWIYYDQRCRWPNPVWASIRHDNIPSLRAALSAGYDLMEANDGKLFLRGNHIAHAVEVCE